MDTFAPCVTTHCCLCGSDQGLSGEHKIKASVLRTEFGRESMVIRRHKERYRVAQGAASKEFHFSAPICGECNSARTQAADLAFDQLHTRVKALLNSGADPAGVFQEQRFAPGGELDLDIYRYFAKLLCCHIAELGAPRQSAIADFAIGCSDYNCISLGVDLDSAYSRAQAEYPGLPFAAHAGLIVLGDKETLSPVAFYSTLTIGPVRYRFEARLTEEGQINLELEEPEFFDWCRERTRLQLLNPISEEERLDLGL